MAESKIRIYKADIAPNRNARIDDIGDYLASLTPTYSEDSFQYQQIGLDLEIKIQVDQKYVGDSVGNYADIEQDGRHYYFFVMGARWRGKKSVRLLLSLDTINTYWEDLEWNQKTSIIRQHANRFVAAPFSSDRHCVIIDKFNEGINPNLSRELKYSAIEDPNVSSAHTWYLVYKSNDNLSPTTFSDPVSMMVLADEPLQITPAATYPTKRVNFKQWIEDNMGSQGYWYQQHIYFTSSGLENAQINFYANSSATTPTFSYNLDSAGLNDDFMRALHVDLPGPTVVHSTPLYYTGDTYPYSFNGTGNVDQQLGAASVEIEFVNVRACFMEYGTSFVYSLTSLAYMDANQRVSIDSGDLPAQETIAFADFQRNGGTLSKIIELPYAPCEVNYSYGNFVFPAGWHFNPGYLGMEAPLRDDMLKNLVNYYDLSDYLSVDFVQSPDLGDSYKGKDFEPKLKSSEFMNLSLVYDTTSIPVKLEKMRQVNFGTPDFEFPLTVQVSNAMSSDLLISTGRNLTYYYDKEKLYDLTAVSTRSLEKPIFNSGYVDYLRNGYNYDQEVAKRQNKIAITNAVVGGLQTAVSIAGAAAGLAPLASGLAKTGKAVKSSDKAFAQELDDYITGRAYEDGYRSPFNPKAAEAAYAAREKAVSAFRSRGVGLGTLAMTQGIGALGSVLNVGNNIEANNAAMAHSLQQQQNSTVGVTASSSVDLMEMYMGDNKVHLSAFTLRDEELDNIAKLFYYAGYSHPVQGIPDTTSRSWFNFIQCKAEFDHEQTSVYSEYLDDIKARLELGVTVYHANEVGGSKEWDLDQTKENWETNLF